MSEDESPFTFDPDSLESDVSFGRAVFYEEAGRKPSFQELNALRPCEFCGQPVIVGTLPDGVRVTVEQDTLTYVLYWRQKTTRKGAMHLPTLTQSRGYPAHTCRGRNG